MEDRSLLLQIGILAKARIATRKGVDAHAHVYIRCWLMGVGTYEERLAFASKAKGMKPGSSAPSVYEVHLKGAELAKKLLAEARKELTK